ncbi:scavenger receptor cysteine-rich type 1 protein M160 [Clinocottus analis]|uniref:scavenger receptor cysteine-rich type 1 protein M160 n=1 Tax=Clinocottus analis TaxID=304258 RepID=UPI0035BFC360
MCFLLLLLLLLSAHHQLLMAQGENRLFLQNGSHPCEGYIRIYHDKELGYVGGISWSSNTEQVVCSSTHCGDPVGSTIMTSPWHIDKVWLNDVKCNGDELDLWSCEHPGWGLNLGRKDFLRKIECSHQIDISTDGFTCAGAVQYSINGGKTYLGYFCADNWGTDEFDLLCKSLDCGTHKEIVEQPWLGWKGFNEKKSKTMTIKCSGIPNVTHLWQCAAKMTPSCQKPASVICRGHKRVQLQGNPSNVCSGQLEMEADDGDWKSVPWTAQNNETNHDAWCQKMHCGTSDDHRNNSDGTNLTCSDNVKVVLMDKNKPSICYGEVHVEVNNIRQPVCSTWSTQAAQVVCSELKCGTVLSHRTSAKTKGIMDYVQCSGNESSLWHCRAKRDHRPFPCAKSAIAYVVCSDSMKVKLMDGPGKCAGRVAIEYEGMSRRVKEQEWTDTNSEIVCGLLGCGKKGHLEIFRQGSGDFLPMAVQCKKNAKQISDCIGDSQDNQPKKAMGITCEGHKGVFLKGNQSCSGLVGIEQGKQTYWYSGSNKTWNQESANTVCRQKHCGEALRHSFISRDDTMKNIWNESYLCSSDHESLFDCNTTTTLPSDHADTIATVKCSGSITVNLTNKCWGNVNVCLGEKCGGVCDDTWTKQKSEMLCEHLGCGNRVLQATNKPRESKVVFKSIHFTDETTHLFQSSFVRCDDNDKTCNRNQAYVVCSGSVKAKFSSSRDKCSGIVKVRYESKLLPVCADALTEKTTRDTICREQKCGHAIKQIAYFGPKAAKRRAISHIKCSANNESLAACTIDSTESLCPPGALQCSGWSKMALTVNMSCSGAAVVHSDGKISAVSFDGWTKTEGDRLCKDLECGNFKSITKTTSDLLWTTNFSCADVKVPDSIWDCQKKDYRSQESQLKKQLFIECQAEPKVSLSQRCYGEVKINDIEVCSSHWNERNSQMVCEEQGCVNAIAGFNGNKSNPTKKYYHVSCEDNHYTLGQCKRFMETCSKPLVSIYCVGNVKFRTTKTCGGLIEVNYGDMWKKVCPLDKSFCPKRLKMLCKQLGCDGHNASVPNQNTDNPVNLETMLSCTDNTQDMKYCLSNQPCKDVNPAEIYCNGYEGHPTKAIVKRTPPMWPKVLGIGFTLVLLILIVVFIRICMVKKGKKGPNVSLMSKQEVGFESGDYDDVMTKSNELEELNYGRFTDASEVITENDVQSTSSFPYDDVEGVAVAQPLTSRAPAQSAGKFRTMLDHRASYEVDDQHLSYDDIEAGPEIPQTEAEVHDSTRTPPESDAQVPVGSGPGNEDNLVPRPVSQN